MKKIIAVLLCFILTGVTPLQAQQYVYPGQPLTKAQKWSEKYFGNPGVGENLNSPSGSDYEASKKAAEEEAAYDAAIRERNEEYNRNLGELKWTRKGVIMKIAGLAAIGGGIFSMYKALCANGDYEALAGLSSTSREALESAAGAELGWMVAAVALIIGGIFLDAQPASAQEAFNPAKIADRLRRNPGLWVDEKNYPDNFLSYIPAREQKYYLDYLNNYLFFASCFSKDNMLASYKLDAEKIKRETYANAGITKISAEDLKDENFKFFLDMGFWPEYFAVFRTHYEAAQSDYTAKAQEYFNSQPRPKMINTLRTDKLNVNKINRQIQLPFAQ